ncbi:MAG: hypothetical protein QG671_2765 [Actinomycetota bacterium]|nr:hypothetical protein [Actinomycetota bacterium]
MDRRTTVAAPRRGLTAVSATALLTGAGMMALLARSQEATPSGTPLRIKAVSADPPLVTQVNLESNGNQITTYAPGNGQIDTGRTGRQVVFDMGVRLTPDDTNDN